MKGRQVVFLILVCVILLSAVISIILYKNDSRSQSPSTQSAALTTPNKIFINGEFN